MRDSYAALNHHLYQVAIAEFISEILTSTESYDRAIEIAAMKECLRSSLLIKAESENHISVYDIFQGRTKTLG